MVIIHVYIKVIIVSPSLVPYDLMGVKSLESRLHKMEPEARRHSEIFGNEHFRLG